MNREESIAEANRILGDAGWEADAGWGCFDNGTCVGGIAPSGKTVYVKNWAAITPDHPKYGPDTPDEPHEAAQWLVDTYGAKPKFRYRRKAAPVAILSEAREDSAHESDSETGEAFEHVTGDGIASGEPVAQPERASEAIEEYRLVGSDISEREAASEGDDVFDADFEDAPDLGAELLEDEAFAHGELPAPDPLDFAPDEIEPEPEHSPGAFIFGDNLAHDRIVRIGQLSEHATELIAAAKAGYSDSEHDAVRSHVVTHLNEAGAYVGGNPKLFDRFIELETVTGRIRRIEIYRDERQDFIRSADREAVASFDPAAGWP